MNRFGLLILLATGLFIPGLHADEIPYDSGNRRDPFIPLVGEGGVVVHAFNPTDLKVQGIIYDPQHGSLVLINGDFYKQGEKVQNATIANIFKDRVILAQDDLQKTLWLNEEPAEGGEKKHDKKPVASTVKKP